MGEPKIAAVPVGAVEVPENRLRELRDFSGLAKSMSEVGLLQPIRVTEGNVLVAGRHRLEAARSLGWEKIAAVVVVADELLDRLAEIDENLQRFDLTVYEQSKHAEERERVLEAMGQRSRRGDNRHSRPATAAGLEKTTADVASEAGMSERSWQQRTKIGRALGPKTRAALDHADTSDEKQRNFLNSTTQLNTVADISEKRGDGPAADAVERVLGGNAKTVYEAYSDYKEDTSGKPDWRKAYDKHHVFMKRLQELAGGVDQAGGLGAFVGMWPESDQRGYISDYRKLAERALQQVAEFETDRREVS